MSTRILFVVVFVAAAPQLHAAEYFVSPRGSDIANGSRQAPFRTVDKAAQHLAAGDTIVLLDGRYAVPVKLTGIHGSKAAPVTISAAPGAKVVFDGTDELAGVWKPVTPDTPEGKLIQPAQWQRIGHHALYAMKLKADICALVYDGRLMSDARWPNACWDDPWRLDRYMVLRKAGLGSKPGVIHDSLTTENTLEESQRWIHYDRSQLQHRAETLGATGLDFTGATVVLSCFWTSFGTRITQHAAGQDVFHFDTAFTGSGSLQQEAIGYVINRMEWSNASKFTRSSHGSIHFFFMGLPALDIPEEWAYHRPSQTLYFMAPGGKRPRPGRARGKRRDYAITIENSSYVQLKGLEFLGAAARLEDCSNSRIENCNFRFSSYNKFAIGNYDMPVTTEIHNARGTITGRRQYGNALVNCRFEYLDGNAFKGSSTGLTVNNVLIHQTQMTTLGNDSRSASFDSPLLVRRVTISDVGASVGIKGGGIDSVYELNNIMRFGGLQYDGAALQMGGRNKYVYRFNWSHDHPKRSFRFDAASYPSSANAFGEMSYNVAWNTPGGFAVKGDDHLLHNNVLIGEGSFELFNMKRWASKNARTLVANNIIPRMSAGTYDWHKPVVRKSLRSKSPETADDFWLQETVAPKSTPTSIDAGGSRFDDGTARGPRQAPLLAMRKNNVYGNADRFLRDPANLDFRPKPDSPVIDTGYPITRRDVPWKDVPITGSELWRGKGPDVGAYEYGATHYWIPGFQYPHASTPIPPDTTATAKPDCDLMWLGGYKADRHDLFFGASADMVANATKDSLAYRATFDNGDNVFDPGKLTPGRAYFWRVDATRDGHTIRGQVWSFRVRL